MRRRGRRVAPPGNRVPRRPGEAIDVARREDRVRTEHECRQPVEPSPYGICRPERLRLADEAHSERLAELLDLLREMPGDDRDALDPGGAQLVQQGDHDRPSVDRQHRFRVPLGQRSQPPSLPRCHDDRFHPP